MTILAESQTTDSIECHITGITEEYAGATQAILIEADKDFRINQVIQIPMEDGRYSYVLHDDMPRIYQVIFEDELNSQEWSNRYFATGNGSVVLMENNINDNHCVDSIASDIRDNIIVNELSLIEKGGAQALLTIICHAGFSA